MKKTAIITGANRGIGLEITKQLLNKNYEVIALCRQSSKDLDALNCQTIEGFDIAHRKTIITTKKSLEDKTVDLLINNAGVWSDESLDDLDENGIQSIQKTIDINAFGPLRVTHEFLALLKENSKIIFITSRMGSIADNSSGGRYGYRISKAALNMAGKNLAEDLRSKKISVGILHPGFVKTRMTGFNGNISPSESAEGIMNCIDKLNLKNTGSFWHSNGEELPW